MEVKFGPHYVKPRKYKQIHTPIVVQGKGKGLMGPLGFLECYNILKDFTFTKKACDVLYKMRYILWVAALLGACDVIQDGRHIGRHLRFYRKLEIVKKR